MAGGIISEKTKLYETYIAALPKAERETLRSVMDYSQNVRDNLSNKPFILTFDETAQFVEILTELRMDYNAIAAGFLHDLFRFPEIVNEIKHRFGHEIHGLVEEYGTVSLLAKQAKKGESEDNYISLVLSIANDFRVILMLIANRYLRIVNFSKLSHEEQVKQAERVIAFYGPLAHRLGLFKYKTVMENIAFQILHPNIFTKISPRVSEKRYQLGRYLNKSVMKLEHELEKYGISCEISGRTKDTLSIHRKMEHTGRSFDQIYDLLAIRAIVQTVSECYKVLAIAQQMYKPIMEEFDDYIQKPKSNGYQSLHLLLEDPDKHKFELQIRTAEMHRTAEIGVAAHWNYKEGNKKSATDTFFKWFREHVTGAEKGLGNKAFENFFQLSEHKNEIFVFTPRGDLKRLPKGATPIDFAFAVHKDIGFRCNGAKVNGHIVPFDREFQNGDRVEILTSHQPTVNADWLQNVCTSRARSEIRRWLRREMRIHSVKLGEEILSRAFRRKKVPLNNSTLKKACTALSYGAAEDLYIAVGSGKISVQTVLQRLLDSGEKENDRKVSIEEKISSRRREPKGIKVGDMDSLMVNFGKCCLPIPGDPIVGYITRGKGVTIHRTICKNIRQLLLEPEREVAVDWELETDKLFAAGLRVDLKQSENFIKEVTPVFGDRNVNLLNYLIQKEFGQESCTLVVDVPNTTNLQLIMKKINALKTVKRITRLRYSEFKSLLRSAPIALRG